MPLFIGFMTIATRILLGEEVVENVLNKTFEFGEIFVSQRIIAVSIDYFYEFILGATLKIDWILPMLIRNVLACWVICGFWDWFLYLSPWQKKLHKFKVPISYSILLCL